MRQADCQRDPKLAAMMKLTMLTCSLAFAGAATLGAQATETTTTTTTKIDLTGGKHVKVIGCVEPGPAGGYILSGVVDKDGRRQRYTLVSDDTFFATHVGNRVEVEGRAADRTHGFAFVQTDTTSSDGASSHAQTDARSDASPMRYLGADHMKMLSTSCP